MNKPKDPRKNGLVEPVKVITEYIFHNPKNISDLIGMYNEWLILENKYKDLGFEIVESPTIIESFKQLRFKIRKINGDYHQQLFDYNEKIKQYEEDLLKYEEYLAKQKHAINNELLDDKIKRLKDRLAKLEAIRNGEISDDKSI